MGIRIRPLEIGVPSEDPFAHDLLARRESVEVLTRIVRSIEGPCALSIDGPWGSGKTTFLRIWDRYLRSHGFSVVKFNAWENDASNAAPFVSLSSELTDELTNHSDAPLRARFEGLIDRFTDLALSAAPMVVKSTLSVVPVVGGQLGETLGSYAKDSIKRYKAAKQSVKEFKEALRCMAEKSKEATKRPLIVMIDELDRCRPTYAIELLEVAKHLFSVDHIVFVLAINRSELAHSIQAIYGDRFDADGYLRRFFDISFQLPDPDRGAFIDAMFVSIGLDSYSQRTQDPNAQRHAEAVQSMARTFFGATDLSIRRISQALHRLGLVYASLRTDQKSFTIAAMAALILRTIAPHIYHRLARGEMSDADVIDNLFDRPSLQHIQQQQEGNLFEAAIAVGAHEEELYSMTPSELPSSPLLQRHFAVVEKTDNEVTPMERERSQDVIAMVERFLSNFFRGSGGIGFAESIRRLELLTNNLIDDGSRHDTE